MSAGSQLLWCLESCPVKKRLFFVVSGPFGGDLIICQLVATTKPTMEVPSVQELEALKYSELQKVAKKAGLRANLKADKLLKALKQYFQHEQKSENDSRDSEGRMFTSSSSDINKLNSNQEKEATAIVHITKRRKRTVETKASPVLDQKSNTQINNILPFVEKWDTEEKKALLGSAGSSRRQSKRHRMEDIPAQPTTVEGTEVMPIEHSLAEDNTTGKIPQYVVCLSKPEQAVMKTTTTPDFKKLHEAHFKKMESIDKYMERKQKRFNAISSSIREVKMLVEKTSLLKPPQKQTPGNNLKKPLNPRMSLFSPLPHKGRHSFVCSPSSQRRSPRISLNVANHSILAEKSVFKPSVLSSSKMNVRFSETTKDNEYKRSFIKTPARKSPYTDTNTPSSHQKKGRPVTVIKSGSKPVSSEIAVEKSKAAALTPFQFSAENIVTPATNKLRFDLKASLARPLGYQPHKGKLRPWGNFQEKPDAVNTSASLKKVYKQHTLQTREERCEMHLRGRKQNKDKMLGARRGLAMP